MSQNQKSKTILIHDQLFAIPDSPSSDPHLIASKCRDCGEVAFPKQAGCSNCCSENVEEVQIGPWGTLFSFTNVNNPVPEGYKGPIPYGIGIIELPEGPRIKAYLTESDPQKLKVGMKMILIIDRLFTDEQGNEIIGYKFKPA